MICACMPIYNENNDSITCILRYNDNNEFILNFDDEFEDKLNKLSDCVYGLSKEKYLDNNLTHILLTLIVLKNSLYLELTLNNNIGFKKTFEFIGTIPNYLLGIFDFSNFHQFRKDCLKNRRYIIESFINQNKVIPKNELEKSCSKYLGFGDCKYCCIDYSYSCFKGITNDSDEDHKQFHSLDVIDPDCPICKDLLTYAMFFDS